MYLISYLSGMTRICTERLLESCEEAQSNARKAVEDGEENVFVKDLETGKEIDF